LQFVVVVPAAAPALLQELSETLRNERDLRIEVIL
jgi:hypothetical protein